MRLVALWVVLFAVYAAGLGIDARSPTVAAAAAKSTSQSSAWRRTGRAGQAPSARAMTICWTSSVPSPIVRIFASR